MKGEEFDPQHKTVAMINKLNMENGSEFFVHTRDKHYDGGKENVDPQHKTVAMINNLNMEHASEFFVFTASVDDFMKFKCSTLFKTNKQSLIKYRCNLE